MVEATRMQDIAATLREVPKLRCAGVDAVHFSHCRRIGRGPLFLWRGRSACGECAPRLPRRLVCCTPTGRAADRVHHNKTRNPRSGSSGPAGIAQQDATLSARLTGGLGKHETLAAAAALLQNLQRDFSVVEGVSACAIARTQSTKSDAYASYSLVQVPENPSLPDEPSSPNRKLAVGAGIAAALMMMAGLLLA